MIDLYASVSPNVVKVVIALEEMSLPYVMHDVQLMKSENFSPDFLKLSPTAKVPVIVDRDPAAGGPYTVFESGAILLYLADKTGKFLPKDVIARHDAIQWLMMQMANIGPLFGQYVHFSRYAPQDKVAYARDRFRTNVRNLLDVIEMRLGDVPYVGGADYTIADMAVLPWMQVIDFILGDGASADYPTIQAWAQGLASRPAIARAVRVVSELRDRLTPFDQGQPEVHDRLFGRGAYSRY